VTVYFDDHTGVWPVETFDVNRFEQFDEEWEFE
jgi:hypothetical protein